MALDPGTVSGVARGIFPTGEDADGMGIWEGLRNGERIDSWEVYGRPPEQAWEIMPEWADWTSNRVNTKNRVLIFEDFVLRLGPGASSRRELLDPVRVVNACEALCIGCDGVHWVVPEYQQPSSAKNFATDERLKKHNLWIKGSAHQRDAMRHLARRYAVEVGAEK